MKRRKQPFQLKTLAMAAVCSYIKHVFYLCEGQGYNFYIKMLSNLSVTLFSSVPCDLSDEVTEAALKSLNKLLRNAKSGVRSDLSILRRLTETITTLHVKCCNRLFWPKIMHDFLCKNLYRLNCLKELYISSESYEWNIGYWKTSEAKKDIVRAVSSMAHLRALYLSLVCTDHILRAVGDTCHSLQILNVMYSNRVTDRSISALLCCSQLQKLFLYRTSITAGGVKSLLDGLPKLQDMGRFHELENVLELLSQEPNTKFHELRKMVCCAMTGNNLQLLLRQFPLLSCFELKRKSGSADLVTLSALHNLTELILSDYTFFADHIDDLLQMSGPKLTLLKLGWVQIDLNALVFISQHCPHLVTFSLYSCQIRDHAGLHNACPTEPAFPCLERLELAFYDCSQHLKFLLSNCCNIRFIKLDLNVDLTDTMMSTVFTRNQMKQLEELHIISHTNLSMKTVQLFMEHCDKLKFISDLRNWKGISSEELAGLRNYIRENNLDLDL